MADLIVKVEFNTKDVKRGGDAIRQEVAGISNQANRAGQQIRSAMSFDFPAIRKRLSEIGDQIRRFGDTASAAGRSLTQAVTLPLTGLGTIAVKSAMEIDAARTKIAALVGGAEKANIKMRELSNLADRSVGVTRKAAFETFAQLKGIGDISDEAINKVIGSLGRLNAAFQIEDLAGFQRNLIQLFTQGFEIQDIKEALGRVPIFRQILKSAFGTDDPQALRDLVRSGKLTIDQYLSSISKAIDGDPRISGIEENLKTRLTKAFERLMQALEPLGIQILNILVPVFATLEPLITRISNQFASLSPTMQLLIIAIGGLAAAAGPVLVVFGGLVSAIGAIVAAGPVIGIVAAAFAGLAIQLAPFIAVAAGWAVAIQNNFAGTRDFVLGVKSLIENALSGISEEINLFLSDLKNDFDKFWAENGEDIKQALATIEDLIRQGLQMVLQFWKENGEEIKQAVIAVWEFIKPFVKNSLDGLLGTIKLAAALINGDWSKAWQAFKQIVSDSFANIVIAVEGSVKVIIAAIESIFNFFAPLTDLAARAGQNVGRAIADGIINGLLASRARISETANQIAAAIPQALKIVLGIRSPSRVAAEIGRQVIDGLAQGIVERQPAAMITVKQVGVGLIDTIRNLFIKGGSLGDLAKNVIDAMSQGRDGLKSIFRDIAGNWRQMINQMASDWINRMLNRILNPLGNAGAGTSATPPTTFPAINGTASAGMRNPAGSLQLPARGVSGVIAGIGSIGVIAGGLIGGRVGGIIQNIAGGALTGLMLGAKIGAIGGPLGAAIGAGAGALLSLFGGAFSNPKRKRDKTEKIPALQRGFTDALQILRDLVRDVRSLQVDPDQAIAKALELRGQIASGFGLQFESKKYSRQAAAMIAAKLAEADTLIAEIRSAAEVARAARERTRRILPEFAGGVYMSREFTAAFRRWNGKLPGLWTGRDTIPAMLSPGEMVLNPVQQARIRAAAGDDVFASAGIPGYAAGGIVTTTPAPVNLTLVFEHSIDADGMVRTTLKNSPEVARQLRISIEDLAANDRLRQRRRGA